MEIKDYIQFLHEQDDITPFPKRKGEYVIAGDRNKLLAKAIEEKKVISFVYDGGPRRPKKISVLPGKRQRVYPVALGANKRGAMVVRCWIEPPTMSKSGYNKKSARDIPNWRTFMVSRLRDIKFTDETFDLSRLTGYKENSDNSMSVIYKSAKFSDKTTPKTVTPPKKVEPPKPTSTPQAQNKTDLPQPKPETKPSPEPQKTSLTGKEENKLNEELIRIKTLMSSIKTL